jgi:translation initiation factor 3 subunit E
LIKRGKNSDGRRLLKNSGHVMQNVEYTDAICEFVNCLSHKFDFEMAQQKLQECEHVLEHDFFLCKQTAVLMEEARVLVFENYCRIHDKIDLGVLAGREVGHASGSSGTLDCRFDSQCRFGCQD